MKLWFIESKPNVFVSGVTDHVALKVVEYLHKYCPQNSGLMSFRSIPIPPGYEIRGVGDTKKTICEISKLQLVAEKFLKK